MTAEAYGRPKVRPRSLHGAIDRERRRLEKASAILSCLVLVLQHAPEKPIEVELLADEDFNLIEKAIDRPEITLKHHNRQARN